ncbi:MAG TPA: hypothetical protein VHX37_06170 [Acidobacteriaceae bacterium]|jgi:hypothetical protein|nr:hypothetical protein [Acidobacteriaceae bacterium]
MALHASEHPDDQQELHSWRRTIDRLPVTLRPSLNGQIALWNSLFPFEQEDLRGFFAVLTSLTSAELTNLTAPLRNLEVKMGADSWNLDENSNTLANTAQLARSACYAEWRREVQRIFAVIAERRSMTATQKSRVPRLILLILPESLPVTAGALADCLAPSAKPTQFSGTSNALCQMLLFGDSGQPSLSSLMASREESDLWLIDADAVLGGWTEQASFPAVSSLSYSALRPLRDRYLEELNTIPRDLTAADQVMLHLRQTDWSPWSPPALNGQPRLRDFVIGLFLSGNGSPVFSNAFVEWASSEALRRARPQVLVARFGVRARPKPFSSIAVFENQEKISPVPDTDDPESSALDAVVLARYIWLAADRYAEYSDTLCLCISDHLGQAAMIAPPGFDLPAGPSSAADLANLVRSWITT